MNSSRLKDFLQGQKREMGPKKSLGGSSSASYYLLFPDGQTTVEHHWIRLVCIFVPATQLSFSSNYKVQLSSRGLPCLCPATVFVQRACITRSPSTSDQRQVPAHRCSPPNRECNKCGSNKHFEFLCHSCVVFYVLLIALNRRPWLFAWQEDGAHYVCIRLTQSHAQTEAPTKIMSTST